MSLKRVMLYFIMIAIFNNCHKSDNLDKFLNGNELITKVESLDKGRKDLIVHLPLKSPSFTISFWMTSKNFSENGVAFNIALKESDELKESKLTMLISKKGCQSFRVIMIIEKKDGHFKNGFSNEF